MKPDIVSMENVPRLVSFKKADVFGDFLKMLEDNGYFYFYEVVNCPDYGIPQNRKRLVLMASKLGRISIIPKTHTPENYVTVKDAIGKMEALESGQTSKGDPIHRAAKLSKLKLPSKASVFSWMLAKPLPN